MVLKLIKLMSQAKLLRPERQVATSLSKALRNMYAYISLTLGCIHYLADVGWPVKVNLEKELARCAFVDLSKGRK